MHMYVETEKIGKPSRIFNIFSYWLPPVLLTAGIFFMAGDMGSFSKWSIFLQIFSYLLPSYSPQKIHTMYMGLRKAGHFVAYAALYYAYARAWRWQAGLTCFKSISLALAICLAVSSADEGWQFLHTSRTGSLWDVALDMSGALTAAIISFPLLRQQGREKVKTEKGLTS